MKYQSIFFAPMIYLKQVAPAIEFYKNAFDAVVLRQWANDDGSVHVAEMSIDGAIFHIHEESTRNNELSPETLKGTNIAMGLFVDDPHVMMAKAVSAGGTEIDPDKIMITTIGRELLLIHSAIIGFFKKVW
jgi:PhnB protein